MKSKSISRKSSSDYKISFSSKESEVLKALNIIPGDFITAKIKKKLSPSNYIINIKGKNVFAESNYYEFNEDDKIFTSVKSFKKQLELKLLPYDSNSKTDYLNYQISKHLEQINYPVTKINVLICRALLNNGKSLTLNNFDKLIGFQKYFGNYDSETSLTLIIKLLEDDENIIDENLHQFESLNCLINYNLNNGNLNIKLFFYLKKLSKFLTEIIVSQKQNIDINLYCISNFTKEFCKNNYNLIKQIAETNGLKLNNFKLFLIEEKGTKNSENHQGHIYTHIDVKI